MNNAIIKTAFELSEIKEQNEILNGEKRCK